MSKELLDKLDKVIDLLECKCKSTENVLEFSGDDNNYNELVKLLEKAKTPKDVFYAISKVYPNDASISSIDDTRNDVIVIVTQAEHDNWMVYKDSIRAALKMYGWNLKYTKDEIDNGDHINYVYVINKSDSNKMPWYIDKKSII